MVVGESRELETAVIAGEASLAGHQVLSTLHTINAFSSAATSSSKWAGSSSVGQ